VHDTVVEAPVQTVEAERHEPWCDHRQHALARADAVGPSGCVGRYVQHGVVGGWVAEDGPEQIVGARFVVDWRPAEGWDSLRPEEAAELTGLLNRLLAEYRRPAPARWSFPWSRRRTA
jgi:hypothetical protein